MRSSFLAKYRYWILFGIVLAVVAIAGTILGIILATSSDDDEESKAERSFTIDHKADTFLMDGKPFQYIAGSFHYFRALPETWRRKLKLLRAAGLNAVDIYVHWALHNPKDGVYNWNGIADVEKFIQIAKEEDLYVILRPGPYICAEIDNGGIPYWLFTKYPNIKLRTSDPDYLREVEKYYSKLMPQFEKHFYGNGGNIIMVQVENEYGSFSACDMVYKKFLRDDTFKYTRDKALLFTTDGPYEDYITCGSVEGVYATVDFGISTLEEIQDYFGEMRKIEPTGPLVNTEFYTGWLTHWHEPTARESAREVADTLRLLLTMKVNVDFYMFYGGTNFGFWAGANYGGIGRYEPDITSYDYDSPIDEAGNPTPKYMILRNVIKEFVDVPDESTIPEVLSAMSMTAVTMKPANTIFSQNGRKTLGSRPFISEKLLTFEELDQFSGFVLYETKLPKFSRDPSNLIISSLRDYGLIYIDDELVGILSRQNKINSLPISAGFGSKLSILVENQGRINYGIADDYKGILGSVRVQSFDDTEDTYFTLSDWTITGFSFDNHADIQNFVRTSTDEYQFSDDQILHDGPVVLHGEFEISPFKEIQDTYWDTQGWGKGIVFVNGYNLGRHWPLAGPQMTIYVPKELLKQGLNEIQVIEMQKVPANMRMSFVNGPIFINDVKLE